MALQVWRLNDVVRTEEQHDWGDGENMAANMILRGKVVSSQSIIGWFCSSKNETYLGFNA